MVAWIIREKSIICFSRQKPVILAARKDIDLDQYAAGYNASDRTLVGGAGSVDLQSQTARRFGFNINASF